MSSARIGRPGRSARCQPGLPGLPDQCRDRDRRVSAGIQFGSSDAARRTGRPGTDLPLGTRRPSSGRDGCRRSVVGVMARPARAPGRRQLRSQPKPRVEWGLTQHQQPEMHQCRLLQAAGPKGGCDCAHHVNLGDDGWLRDPPLHHPARMKTGTPTSRCPKLQDQLCAVPAGFRNQDWSRLPERCPKESAQQSGPAASGLEVSVRTLGGRT